MEKFRLTYKRNDGYVCESQDIDFHGEDLNFIDVLSRIRGFLNTVGFGEDLIDKFIINPYAEYSNLTEKEKFNARAVLLIEEDDEPETITYTYKASSNDDYTDCDCDDSCDCGGICDEFDELGITD